MGENERLVKEDVVRKIGNYTGIISLDKTARQISDLSAGDKIRIIVEKGKVIVEKLEDNCGR